MRNLLAILAALSATLSADSIPFRHEPIFDPVLKMNAFNIGLPANWKFQGAVVQGSSCQHIPFPVVRAYSPDGLSEWRKFPRFDWTWQTGTAQQPNGDCLDLQQALTAREFLLRMTAAMNSKWVRDDAVPQAALDNAARTDKGFNDAAANTARQFRQTPAVQKTTIAAIYTEFLNGTFFIEEHYLAKVSCTHRPGFKPGTFSDICAADVRVIRAPKGQLEPLLTAFKGPDAGARAIDQWMIRYTDVQRQKNDAILAAFRAENQRAHEIRMEQGRQFQAALRQSTERSMAAAQASATARHRIASDVCDYVLDRQTVSGPSGLTKISNAYGHTWDDGHGHYYQTNDPNANPNGTMPGVWKEAPKVHGDGSPY